MTTVLYAIPSLAFFVVLIDYTGQTELTVMIPLALYSLVVLIPAIVDGVRAVPPETLAAATAMGFGPLRAVHPGAVADRRPRHHRRPAGGHRVQHLPGQSSAP